MPILAPAPQHPPSRNIPHIHNSAEPRGSASPCTWCPWAGIWDSSPRKDCAHPHRQPSPNPSLSFVSRRWWVGWRITHGTLPARG